MSIFAMGDLHLSGEKQTKPMDIFGENWVGYVEKIEKSWQACVAPTDWVLLPGDISWAMNLEQAQQDLDWIARLPGKKVLLRGNHDYWWQSIGKVRGALPADVYALQNDAMVIDDYMLCGTRGWLCPGSTQFTQEDEKIYAREIGRLKLSLDYANARNAALPKIVMMHYPPFHVSAEATGFTELITAYGVQKVLYGHLHGPSLKYCFAGELQGVEYIPVSSDYLDFNLKKIIAD